MHVRVCVCVYCMCVCASEKQKEGKIRCVKDRYASSRIRVTERALGCTSIMHIFVCASMLPALLSFMCVYVCVSALDSVYERD